MSPDPTLRTEVIYTNPYSLSRVTLALLGIALVSVSAPRAQAQAVARSERARDIGIPLEGTPGPLNAITDVPGVAVGHTTLIRGSGPLKVGQGPVRTGVTAIFPRGTGDLNSVFAGWFSLNGNGEMTGTAWIDDYGLLLYPITITNTNSVGVVRDAVIEWGRTRISDAFNCCLPVTAETWDGDLNDIYGGHVKKEHVFQAFAAAKPGPVPEGNVGGGTGMQCLGFKGGIGTASRRLSERNGGFNVGVLVQCNFGQRRLLRIAGAPVGLEITDLQPCYEGAGLDSIRAKQRCPGGFDVGYRRRLHHRRRGDRRTAAAAPAPARGAPRRAGHRADGRGLGRGVGRSLHRLLHRADRRGGYGPRLLRSDAARRSDRSGLRGDGPGDRGGDHQRHARGAHHEGRGRPGRAGPAARPAAGGAPKVRAAGEVERSERFHPQSELMTMGELTNGGRERAYRALHDSEELHRVTLSSISDAVFLTDDDGQFTFICPNVDVIFGYVPDEVQAMVRISRLLGENLFDRSELAARGEIRNIEREVVSKSGEHRSLLIHLKEVSIRGGTVLYSCRDVTDRRHAEEELRTVRQELAHASRLALLGELMASIGHEINQPLAAIRSNASAGLLLLNRDDEAGRARGAARDLRRHSRPESSGRGRHRADAGAGRQAVRSRRRPWT